MRTHRLFVSMSLALVVVSGSSRAADPDEGARLYELHCEVCHAEDGRGRVAGAPDFSRGQGLLVPDSTLVQLLRKGRGSMPAYEGLLREHQLLDLIAYLRTFHR